MCESVPELVEGCPYPWHLFVHELSEWLGYVGEVWQEFRKVLNHAQKPLDTRDDGCSRHFGDGSNLGSVCSESLLSLPPLSTHLLRNASKFLSWSLMASSCVPPHLTATKSSATTPTPRSPSMS